jgi:hypothetical protein
MSDKNYRIEFSLDNDYRIMDCSITLINIIIRFSKLYPQRYRIAKIERKNQRKDIWETVSVKTIESMKLKS